MIPKILLQKAEELEAKTAQKLPSLAPLAKQCFLNTIETTVTELPDGSAFVITGDIPAHVAARQRGAAETLSQIRRGG